ncbi:DUF3800 domain-containing protein [Sphingomonas psychrolutea]|uniref:DUF3800 domain-containing protein n=1 Tax=Sphingomonas psychrolutea TaxID=1259676 RepID=A0ABQ1GNV1_9SPHN|nr:DUF3800 domain-containing protein [Sphingomonas psychrolutea]GGA47132.1 hypothetical protein GCM10011395_16700 [Sphingomonas psychrolutea]
MAIIVSDPAPGLPNLSFFGDASSRDKTFMVAGGFAVAGNRINEIEDAIAALRDDAGIKSEFHWSDYRGGKRQDGYEKLVQYAFRLIAERKAALHIIISNFDEFNHKAKEGENRDSSINKMYFQLLLHRVARYYGKTRAIHVRLDAGNDSKDVCALRGAVCAKSYYQYKTKANCIRTIEPVCSRRVGIVQMADVVMGAISAKRNDVKHTSPKGELANFVLKASGRHSWNTDTAYAARFLTVWHHTPR